MQLRIEDDQRATAAITLVEGAVSAGITGVINTYGYKEDSADEMLFWLGDQDECVGLKFSPDWTSVLVFGDSSENIENLNYILNRGGWDSASAVVATVDIEEQLLGSFSSTIITEITRSWEMLGEKSSAPPVANVAELQNALGHATPVLRPPAPTLPTAAAASADAYAPPPTPQPAAAATAEPRPAQNDGETRRSRSGDHDKLLQILEGMVLAQLESSLREHTLVKQLGEAGYAVTLRIVAKQA